MQPLLLTLLTLAMIVCVANMLLVPTRLASIPRRFVKTCNRELQPISQNSHFTALKSAYYLDINDVGMNQAAQLIRQGDLVAFPTETVYGLGANALNHTAVEKIFKAKHRPYSDPLIVHIAHIDSMDDLFDFEYNDADNKSRFFDERAKVICKILAESFWPGPLTIIYRASSKIPLSVTSGTGFVGLRIPKHHVARRLIELSGLPIAAPSANRFGHVSPTLSRHVMEDLKDENVAILMDNANVGVSEEKESCEIGIESTVCRVSQYGESISILRWGAVTASQIVDVLRQHNVLNCSVVIQQGKAPKPKVTSITSSEDKGINSLMNGDVVSPGQLIKHYAPDIPTYIVSKQSISDMIAVSKTISNVNFPLMLTCSVSNEKFLDANTITRMMKLDLRKCIVIDYNAFLKDLPTVDKYFDLSATGDINEAYREVFKSLRNAESFVLDNCDNADTNSVSSIKNKDQHNSDHSAISYQSDDSVCLLLPDLYELSLNDERICALWERLVRAASGQYLHVRTS